MAVNQNKNNHEEEVDLGTLFQIIGRGFTKFFNFIGSIFKGIFHFVVISLIFLKTNILKIGLALLLGLIIGYFLESNRLPVYQSEMLIQPNFKSARQLYNNINYYNDLVKQKEHATLATLFDLDEERAASLKKFEIEPIVLENDIIEAYDQLIISIDTATVRSYDYELFKQSFTDFDYKTHRINVVAEKNDVFTSVGTAIVASLENHPYFKSVKSIYNESTNTTDSLYRQNLVQIDSLRQVYMKVLIEQAKKETTGTNIDMRGEQRRAKELELFDVNRRVSEELKTLVKEKSEGYEVVNVISDFQSKGNELRGLAQNYIFLMGFGLAGIMIAFLLLVKLNRFLDEYQKT